MIFLASEGCFWTLTASMTSEVIEAVRGQNYHEGVDLLKKILNESFSATS